MSLAEGVSARIAYKQYSTGVITSNTEPVSSVDPGASGGQILRRVSSSLNLTKDTYQSNEVRTDRQIVDFRHGTRRANGSVSGEWSPGTYFDFMEAACRGTKSASAVALSNTDFTSAAADSTLSTFTFAGGDAHALGLRVGDVVRFTNLSATTNNSKNFVILAMTGSNRVLTVYPAPTTMTADTTFNVTTVGKSVSPPTTGHVSRKFAIEEYFSDIDFARLFLECRIGGINLSLPATGIATIEVPVMGRDAEVYEATSAPFFTAPTAETSTGVFASVNGLIRVNGVNRGVVTGQTINMAVAPSSDAVVGQNFVPEIFLGRVNVTGQLNAMLEGADLFQNFLDEDEIEVLTYLTTSTIDASPACTVYLPRVKFGDASVAVQGEGAQIVTIPFQALKYGTAATGIEATTIRFVDTEAV